MLTSATTSPCWTPLEGDRQFLSSEISRVESDVNGSYAGHYRLRVNVVRFHSGHVQAYVDVEDWWHATQALEDLVLCRASFKLAALLVKALDNDRCPVSLYVSDKRIRRPRQIAFTKLRDYLVRDIQIGLEVSPDVHVSASALMPLC